MKSMQIIETSFIEMERKADLQKIADDVGIERNDLLEMSLEMLLEAYAEISIIKDTPWEMNREYE